jgi:GAF domain-containing protein
MSNDSTLNQSTPQSAAATAPADGRGLFGEQTRRYALAGIAFGLVFPAVASLIRLAQLQLAVNLPNVLDVQRADSLLWIIDTAPLFLGLFAGLAGREQDRLLAANTVLREQGDELKRIQANLEQHVVERTAEFEGRTQQLRASAYIAQQIAQFPDVPTVLSRAAQLISEQFDFYHVGLFLLDDQRRTAFLQAASSAPGQALLERGYRVDVGDENPIGRVAERGKLYLQTATGASAAPEAIPDFPLTRSRLVLPLTIHGKMIGVMDIQSKQPRALGQNEAEIFQLLADQIAAAIDNIRLVNESQAFVSQLQMLTSQQTRVAWRERLKDQRPAYQFTPSGIKPMPAPGSRRREKNELMIPLLLRGQEIGSIGLKRKDESQWNNAERELVEKVAVQVALALDNSRLLEETRQRAIQEQTVNEISARLSRSLDIDTLLQTAVRELGALPEVAEVSVFIGQADGKK